MGAQRREIQHRRLCTRVLRQQIPWSVAALFALCSVANAIFFVINEGEQRCILEELPAPAHTVVEFHVSSTLNSTDAQIPSVSVTIYDADDETVALMNGKNGLVKFKTKSGGDYNICFQSKRPRRKKKLLSMKVYFDIRCHDGAIDYDVLAKTYNLNGFQTQVRKLYDRAIGIRLEQEYMQEVELSFHEISETIHNRILWFCVVQIVVLVILGFIQLHCTKRYLRIRKII
eukprot:TRINITY_DN17567_c0_g1_i1.p1 TRINITY_DN17567_c0_g1~~TRINITY_DN17567_c0_g1_i1.p1  ORF type:complete len:230 (+),score=31.38 TRINITY_DN17567_c0_g1_i1:109-798(+)